MTRHAEISGGGFAGLTAAVVLLQNGWSVRVHERTPSVRSEGFGIAMHENGLRVLQALGVLDALIPYSVRITRRIVRNAAGDITSSVVRDNVTNRRMSRDKIVNVLASRVVALGGEVVTASAVAGANPAGKLILENGKELPADLVIGADGYNSKVQELLGLLQRRIMLRDGAMRLVIPRRASERDAMAPGCGEGSENWSGTRRVICIPCGPDEVYVAMSCLYGDTDGMAVPVRDASWRTSFPYLADEFDRMAKHTDWARVRWVRFQVVKLEAWSCGKVAVVGDAAHAMPPNLGQGGGSAMVNAYALATAVSRDADIERALTLWEQFERPVIEHTQLWSRVYGAVTFWPKSLRSLAFKVSDRSPWIKRQLARPANHVPLGLDARGLS